MNTVLEQLLAQSKLQPYYDEQAGQIEKFAELIVRECCDVFVELRTRPADLAVKDVKNHFGVEE